MSDGGRTPPSLAEKLDHLIRVGSQEQGRALSTNDVAAAINIKAGEPVISGNYIWQLRKGKRSNPTKRHIEALAEYFDIPAAYFHDRPSSKGAVTSSHGNREARSGTSGHCVDPGPSTLAEKLDRLLQERALLSCNAGPVYPYLAADIARQAGEAVSARDLRRLHHGEDLEPPMRVLGALATYFGVSVSYFTDSPAAQDATDEETTARRELDESMVEAGVSAVYLCGDLAALSPEGKRMAAEMIRQIRDLEQGTIAQRPPPRT